MHREFSPEDSIDLPETLDLTLPDWSGFDTVCRNDLPFILWPVGPQPLLFHWFDYAHDLRLRKVVLYSADRPERIRAALRAATLWPIEFDLVPITDESDGKGVIVRGLPEIYPNGINGGPGPEDGWDLLDYWFKLDRDWHDYRNAHANRNVSHENIGTGCVFDPTAFIREPVQIGDHVFIGPGCRIGPYASIGDGCLIEGHSTVEHARLAPDTFLSTHTELKNAYLDSGRLFNLTHRAVIDSLDAIVSMGGNGNRFRDGGETRTQGMPGAASNPPARHLPAKLKG